MQRQRITEHLLSASSSPFYREYRDILTGTTARRAEYQQMLTDAAHGRFSHLGLHRADRFGRDTVEGLQAATKLMSLGIKIRVAHMPSLQPETPDGFFMFVLQMGLAQREVDVLRQRARDGMEAKLRAGGWACKAPDGYVNKEEAIKNGKYHRCVEQDPAVVQGLREAWDLLLTDRYTMKQICRELAARGCTRSGDRPWAWIDPESGRWNHAANRLHEIFHNPFYAGWVVSKRFGIAYGQVRGKWEPVVTMEEFERGLEVLCSHDAHKSRTRRHFYLLRGLLWVEVGGARHKMFCSTPTGRSRSYSYYLTHDRLNGQKIRIPCEIVDAQIPNWLRGITIDPEDLPAIWEIYRKQVARATHADRETEIASLSHRLAQLREEEARLGRLLITGKMSEETYDRLRAEWQEKLRLTETNLADLERDTAIYLDDLDTALILLTRACDLYSRLENEQHATLLQILAKRIIVSADGEMIDHELHSPFKYLAGLVASFQSNDPNGRGSEQVRVSP